LIPIPDKAKFKTVVEALLALTITAARIDMLQ